MENLLYGVLGLEFVLSSKGHLVLLFLLYLFYTKWESAGLSNIIFPFCNIIISEIFPESVFENIFSVKRFYHEVRKNRKLKPAGLWDADRFSLNYYL